MIVVIVFFVMMKFNLGNLFTAFIGVLGLKISAYLQPFTHKFVLKLQEEWRHLPKAATIKNEKGGGENVSNAILMSGGADDIDFMIHGLFSYQLFGHTVWITTSHVCILIVMLVILIFAVIANRKIKHATEVPDGFQNVIELIVEKLDGVVMGTMGKVAGPKFVNYISTIFIFIFMSNISGLFGLRPPTADYGTTLALGLITFS